MIVRELLEMLDATKSNQLPDGILMKWINDVEGRVHCEIFKEDPDSFSPKVGEDDELTVPDAYAEVYLNYLTAKLELMVGDRVLYSSLKKDYEEALLRFAKYVIRNK